MRKLLVAGIFFSFLISGCSSLEKLVPPVFSGYPATSIGLENYVGLKAKIAVADFEVKAAKAGAEVAAGLRSMLITGLTQSNRFLVTERQADLIIAGQLSEFDPQTSGGRGGIGPRGGAGSGAVGGLLGASSNRAYLVLEIRIIEPLSQAILATRRLPAQATDLGGSGPALSSSLSVYANTPMEKAIRMCIGEAVRFIAQATPAKYYKY